MSDRRGCICGGALILGDFQAETEEAQFRCLAATMPEFLRGAGASTGLTMKEWARARNQLAVDLALVRMLERGEVEVLALNDDGEALVSLKPEVAR